MGDISAPKAQLEAFDARISHLERRLLSSVIVEIDTSTGHLRGCDRVRFGTRVTCLDDKGREQIMTLVGPEEADPARGPISWNSPVAQALAGASIGDEVEARKPRGTVSLEVTEIEHPEWPAKLVCWSEVSEGTAVAVILTTRAGSTAFQQMLERTGWDLFTISTPSPGRLPARTA